MKEADHPSITPEESTRYKKNQRRDLGIYRCSAGLSTFLCANEDGEVDFFNGHWASDFKLALKQWQIKDLLPCHTAVCSIIDELMQGKLVHTEEAPLVVTHAEISCLRRPGRCVRGCACTVGSARTYLLAVWVSGSIVHMASNH